MHTAVASVPAQHTGQWVNPQKADSTLRSSQAVPHPSTNRALRRLTSEVERDPVHSTRYGRQRETMSTRVYIAHAEARREARAPTCVRRRSRSTHTHELPLERVGGRRRLKMACARFFGEPAARAFGPERAAGRRPAASRRTSCTGYIALRHLNLSAAECRLVFGENERKSERTWDCAHAAFLRRGSRFPGSLWGIEPPLPTHTYTARSVHLFTPNASACNRRAFLGVDFSNTCAWPLSDF